MTKRKEKALTPAEQWREETESGDYCYRYAMPDGRRLAIHGDGRDFARKMLAQALSTRAEMWIWGKPDGTQFVSRGASGSRKLLARFNLPDLKRELSPKHFALVQTLYEALKEQTIVASYAVGVAEVELGTAAGRSRGGNKAGAIRKHEATEREGELKAKAKKIRVENRSASNSDIARSLSERHGLGGAEAIRKKLRGLPHK